MSVSLMEVAIVTDLYLQCYKVKMKHCAKNIKFISLFIVIYAVKKRY